MGEVANNQIYELLQTSIKKSDEIKEEIKSIKAEFSKEINTLKKQNQNLEEENLKLTGRIVKIERQLKKYNIIFYGIAEQEHRADDITAVLSIINTKLGLECDYSDIRDTYRIGQPKDEGKPRPVVIECINNQLKHYLLQNAKKLKGSDIFLSSDYTPEDYEKRKVLVANLKIARENKVEAYIRGNKLIVDGDTFSYEELERHPVTLQKEPEKTVIQQQANHRKQVSVDKLNAQKPERILKETRGSKRKGILQEESADNLAKKPWLNK